MKIKSNKFNTQWHAIFFCLLSHLPQHIKDLSHTLQIIYAPSYFTTGNSHMNLFSSSYISYNYNYAADSQRESDLCYYQHSACINLIIIIIFFRNFNPIFVKITVLYHILFLLYCLIYQKVLEP